MRNNIVMRNNIIKEILNKELKTIIKDKKSLMMMFVLPIFIPVFILIFSYYFNIMEDNKEIYNIGINYDLSTQEEEYLSELNLKAKKYNGNKDLEKAYYNKKIIAYIIKKDNDYKIYVNSDSEDGSYAYSYIVSYLENLRKYLGTIYLTGEDIEPDNVYNIITYNEEKLEGNNFMSTYIFNMGLTFAIMAVCLTCIYSATGIIASERENGTLETILTLPIKGEEIIFGKYLSIFICAIITSILSIILLISSFFISQKLFNIEGINLSLLSIIITIIIFILSSICFSGLSIMLASTSKSYKEAQEKLTPLSLVTIIPMFLNIMGIKTNLIISIIPIINSLMLLNDLYTSNINNLYIYTMFISSIIFIILIIKYVSNLYRKENILFWKKYLL